MNEEHYFRDSIVCITCIVLIFFIVIFASKCDEHNTVTPPVKERINIDSVLKTNDSIKLVVYQKDSIKYEEVFKVRNLDNDSTIKLFKELVRE